ncbi:hypothetical protein [Corallococcus sp. M7]
MADPKSLKLKLSLKKETLREVADSQLGVLDQVVGGTGSPPPPPVSANCCYQTDLNAN